jgi:hypothetical protein
LAVGDLVKGFSYDGGFVLDLADIMETDIPLVARPVKDVGVAAGNIVAFQDQHFFTGIPGEQSRGGETTDPGADDNGVPGLVKGQVMKVRATHVDIVYIRLGPNVVNVNISGFSLSKSAHRPYHHGHLKRAFLQAALALNRILIEHVMGGMR